MEKSADVFAWTRKLECPPTICNDSVKKILHAGLVGLLLDELVDVIFPAEDAKTMRKNILLHQLKYGTPDKVVQCVQNISQLNSDGSNLQNQISKLEEEYEQLDLTLRKKAQKLRDTSSKYSQIKARRDLLKMKHDQTITQLRDCNDMRLVCQHLMPSTCKDLDPKVLVEILSVVTSLWTGANKRQIILLENADVLIKSETMKPMETEENNKYVEIAKVYGQHVSMVLMRLLYNARANNHQQSVLEFIRKIEIRSNNSADVSEWLAATLEVRKLETELQNLQEEVDKILENLHENNTFVFDLAQLTSEIQNIDIEITEYMQDIQQSLNLLKSAPTFLMKTKEKICLELQRIEAMRNGDYDSTWLHDDLSTELDKFHDALDLCALRKIMLKGDIGVYRHTKCCFSEASVSVTNSQVTNTTFYFPMIQTPIYSLIECYKNLVTMFVYKRFESLEMEETLHVFGAPILTYEGSNDNTLELLNASKAVNVKTRAEIDEFNEILNAWINQTVQKGMEIIEKSVDDVTFPEWLERYSLLLYMIQNST
ncbi:uncharacterized protein LOC143366222 isoform X2 [Andrena cerasifolii]|uniref:uncharacterized protein LOC143366222 isoform X2 n=1 Tax=Andrena cerasifolii TaxID=2819439 RepID=UPI0040383B9C